MKALTTIVCCLSLLAEGAGYCQNSSGSPPEGMVYIPAGEYEPLYTLDSNKVKTEAFYMDEYPVTNREYQEFVRQNSAWKKENVKPVFADENYLKQWKDGTPPAEISEAPVTNISWFAAKAYCECQGKRLPGVDEWEFVALAGEEEANGADDPKFYQKALDWYARPTGRNPGKTGSTFENYYGVWDMYGLVWEWVYDFNTALISGESRGDTGIDRNLFCGSGASGAADPSNYVAFMRYAFRASLKANYTVKNLGFRCAKSIEKS